MVRPLVRREAAVWLRAELLLSERFACRALGLQRSTCRYRPRPGDDGEIRKAIRAVAAKRPRYGYRRLHVLLRRDGWAINHKRTYRLYQEEGLTVRKKRRKEVSAGPRVPLGSATRINQHWGMDFVSDTLANGRGFRCLTIVDELSKESPAIEVDHSLPGRRVVEVLDRLKDEGKLPDVITVDNGPEFVCRELDAWAHRNGVALRFIRPGKPMENAFIESFNGKFRDECLNEHWFEDLLDARGKIESYRVDYNQERPHSALGNLSPATFAARIMLHQLPRLRLQ